MNTSKEFTYNWAPYDQTVHVITGFGITEFLQSQVIFSNKMQEVTRKKKKQHFFFLFLTNWEIFKVAINTEIVPAQS